MSGPKDYSILFSAARLVAQSARIAENQRRRNEALQRRAEGNRMRLAKEAARLERRRKQRELKQRREAAKLELEHRQEAAGEIRDQQINVASSRLDMQGSKHAADRDKRLDRKAKENQSLLAQAQAEMASQASKVKPESDSKQNLHVELESNDDSSELRTDSDSDIDEVENSQVSSQLQEATLDVLQWQEELREDQDVVDFQKTESSDWSRKHASTMDDSDRLSETELLEQTQTLVRQAKEIHEKAGELAAKFNTRNELLGDIIASLKEVGFVVNDPTFENDANPSGAVRLVATRGNERMEASIDLSEEIRSTWDNVSDEHCKTGFFEYVDAMANKGIKVSPHRDDLRERPIRIQKGAKDLPRDKSGNA